jgi:low temperature requirement protein LtrA
VKQLVTPLRLRSLTSDAHDRKVTWLELFFDLVFVAAVAQVAAPLHQHFTVDGLIRFTPLFVLVWWAWTGHAVFCTRFDTDDAVQRGLTLVLMFVVAVMAANAKDALDSRSSAGFAAAYAGVRLVLVAQYFRARHIPEARGLTTRYLAGHGTAAILWLASAVVSAPERFWVWGLAFAIDLGTPWLAVRHSAKAPPDAAHLPERFGLFTLILLGESVVAVMQGMESQEDWPAAAAVSAFLGIGLLFLIWWWYFDGVEGASAQPVKSRRDAVRFHIWSYAHLPLYFGIVIVGVGVQRIVINAARTTLTSADALILTSAVTVVMLAMTVVGATSSRQRGHRTAGAVIHVALALVTIAAVGIGEVRSPVVLIVMLAASCVAQLSVSLHGAPPVWRPPYASLPHAAPFDATPHRS